MSGVRRHEDEMRSTLSYIGKYELRSVLARTGTSIVYDGWDTDIARRVAMKTVPLSSLEDSDTREALARFKRGVQAAGQLAHPNVINIYDYGETDEYAYIVMEFVDGPTLKQMLDSEKRFDVRATCKIMNGILDGLQYSHDRGVVHRDMKPANIMFTKDQRVKITDFGIARLEDSDMTQTGMVIGTPAYMSPEQFMGEKIDWRSDIYSTGVVLYHMITGARPYEGNLATIMNKVLNSPVPRPSVVSQTVTPLLDEIVTRAMAKKREHRFQSAAEMNAALQSILARQEQTQRPVMNPRFERSLAPRRARRRGFRASPLVVAGVVVVVAGTGLGATLYLRQSTSNLIAVPPESPQPPPVTESRKSGESPAQFPAGPVPRLPDTNSGQPIAPPVEPTPDPPVRETPAFSPNLPDNDRKGVSDFAPPSISTPPVPAPDPSYGANTGQSTPQIAPQPPRLIPVPAKQLPPAHRYRPRA
jgi:eukaryotic-like serine/threonine-protein kinase